MGLGALVCLLAGIFFLLPFFPYEKDDPPNNTFKVAAVFLGGFAIIDIFIFLTGIGFREDNVGLNWGPAGTPLTFAQVNLFLSTGFLLSFLIHFIGSKIKDGRSRWMLGLDIGIFLALWGLSVFLWSHQTISPSH